MDARSALNAVKWLHTVVWAFWRCPLTDVAARYTTDRAENFDIHLPLWLAKYNKIISLASEVV